MNPTVAVWLGKKWVLISIMGALTLGAYRASVYFDSVGYQRRDLQAQKEMQAVRNEADKRTAELQKAAEAAQKEKDNAIEVISGKLDSALVELRNRPPRSGRPGVPPSSGTCAGSTGAELSRPDAEFLVWEAARADRLQASLIQCYTQYKKVADSLGVR